MEFIQACGRCLPALRISPHHLPAHGCSMICTSSILYSMPKMRCGSRFRSTSTATRAILESSASGKAPFSFRSGWAAKMAVGSDRSLAIKKRASEISVDLKGTSIFLVGINSTYKSSLGRILADSLRYYYFDSDNLVEEAAGGKSAAVSYLESDKEGYLVSETEVLKQLSSMGRLVVNAGNGAIKSAPNLALLRHGISIWVDVPLDLVAKEITEDRLQFSVYDTAICRSSLEDEMVSSTQLAALYNGAWSGYATADATISLQKVASQLGYDELDAVTTEDLFIETLKEIERLVRVKKMMEEASKPF